MNVGFAMDLARLRIAGVRHSRRGLRLRRQRAGCRGRMRWRLCARPRFDGICDDEDTCLGSLDECGICNGPGPVYGCGCDLIPIGDCDCEGNQLDALGVCGGPCAADWDGDGICDDVDDCVGSMTFAASAMDSERCTSAVVHPWPSASAIAMEAFWTPWANVAERAWPTTTATGCVTMPKFWAAPTCGRATSTRWPRWTTGLHLLRVQRCSVVGLHTDRGSFRGCDRRIDALPLLH